MFIYKISDFLHVLFLPPFFSCDFYLKCMHICGDIFKIAFILTHAELWPCFCLDKHNSNIITWAIHLHKSKLLNNSLVFWDSFYIFIQIIFFLIFTPEYYKRETYIQIYIQIFLYALFCARKQVYTHIASLKCKKRKKETQIWIS